MAAKTWTDDFRFSAIQASIQIAGVQQDDPFSVPTSFCIPVGERPIVGMTPGRVSLMAIVIGFGLLIAGVAIGSTVEGEPGQEDPIVMAGALSARSPVF